MVENNDSKIAGTSNEMPENGKPYFIHPQHLNSLVPKPSGNFVRLRCVGTGKEK